MSLSNIFDEAFEEGLRGGSRTATTFKMEYFVIIING